MEYLSSFKAAFPLACIRDHRPSLNVLLKAVLHMSPVWSSSWGSRPPLTANGRVVLIVSIQSTVPPYILLFVYMSLINVWRRVLAQYMAISLLPHLISQLTYLLPDLVSSQQILSGKKLYSFFEEFLRYGGRRRWPEKGSKAWYVRS